MALANNVVWRNLQGSKNFSTPVTIAEAIEQANTNYNVVGEPLVRMPQEILNALINGEMPNLDWFNQNRIIETHKATVRDDADMTLGIVGQKYGIVQNEKAFEFIDFITGGSINGQRPIIETVGILNDGARMFVTAKMPTEMYINGDNTDPIEDYILFTNTHDGSGAVMAFFTPLRVICQNTLNAAIRHCQNKLCFKHSLNVNKRLDLNNKDNLNKATKVLEMHDKFKVEFIQQLQHLASQRINATDIDRFVTHTLVDNAQMVSLIEDNGFKYEQIDELPSRTLNRIYALKNSIESGIGQDKNRGTKLWLYNGITTYFQNDTDYITDKVNDDEKKMQSLILDGGTHLKKVQNAYNYLMSA